MLQETFLDAAAAALDLARSPEVEAAWAEPSALADMSVGALAVHLTAQITNLRLALAAPVDGEPIDGLDHYTRSAWVASGHDGEDNVRLRVRSAEQAADGPREVLAERAAALEDLRATLPGLPLDRPVYLPWAGWAVTLEDLLDARLMELLVHSDDLAAGLGVDPPAFGDEAADRVVTLLARLAVRRHGAMPVLRALSRTERAPATVSAL